MTHESLPAFCLVRLISPSAGSMIGKGLSSANINECVKCSDYFSISKASQRNTAIPFSSLDGISYAKGVQPLNSTCIAQLQDYHFTL